MQTALAFAEACPHPTASSSDLCRKAGPPSTYGTNDALSDRPTCRIYSFGSSWILQLDRSSAWVAGAIGPGLYRSFRTLAAAIRFADRHGLDYRIVRRRPLLITSARRRLGAAQDRKTGSRA